MEDARAERADTHGQKHVPELRDRRVREYALDVELNQSDRAGKERRHRANHRHDDQSLRRMAVEHRIPTDHVHAGSHHGRGVYESGDRGGPFHRVRKPDMERNLS